MDIGGTNARVAIGDHDRFVFAAEFKCNSSRDLVQALHSVAEQVNQIIDCKKFVKAGCIDVAGPVSELGQKVEITNYKGGEDNLHRNLSLCELPSLLFPPGHSRIINDLESACYGISGLNAKGTVGEYFKHFLGGEIKPFTKMSFDHRKDFFYVKLQIVFVNVVNRSCYCCWYRNGCWLIDGFTKRK